MTTPAEIHAQMRPRAGDGWVLLALMHPSAEHTYTREQLARMVFCGWATVCKQGRAWAYAITPAGRHALAIAGDPLALGAWWEQSIRDMVEGWGT